MITTPASTCAPLRTELPPGTTRTPSAAPKCRGRIGRLLDARLPASPGISIMPVDRKPARIASLTQAFADQVPSADREAELTAPDSRASRRSSRAAGRPGSARIASIGLE